jgi:hypothetical protein
VGLGSVLGRCDRFFREDSGEHRPGPEVVPIADLGVRRAPGLPPARGGNGGPPPRKSGGRVPGFPPWAGRSPSSPWREGWTNASRIRGTRTRLPPLGRPLAQQPLAGRVDHRLENQGDAYLASRLGPAARPAAHGGNGGPWPRKSGRIRRSKDRHLDKSGCSVDVTVHLSSNPLIIFELTVHRSEGDR